MHNPHVPFARSTTEWIHIFYGTACDQVFVKMSVERCRWHTMAVGAVTHRLQTDTRFKLLCVKFNKMERERNRLVSDMSHRLSYVTWHRSHKQAYKRINRTFLAFVSPPTKQIRPKRLPPKSTIRLTSLMWQWSELMRGNASRVGSIEPIHIFATILDWKQFGFEPSLGFAGRLHNTTIICTACIFAWFLIFNHLRFAIYHGSFFFFIADMDMKSIFDFHNCDFNWIRESYDDRLPTDTLNATYKIENELKLKWNWKWSKYAIISFIRNDFVVYRRVMPINNYYMVGRVCWLHRIR